MMRIFHCQHCQQPFQVERQYAGQTVQCPSCSQLNSIPEDAFSGDPPPNPAADQVFACTQCQGRFQVPAGMSNTAVRCPHCEATIQIQDDTNEHHAGPQVDTSTLKRRKTKSSNRGQRPFVAPESDPNLFAPGFQSPEPSVPEVAAKRRDPKAEPPDPGPEKSASPAQKKSGKPHAAQKKSASGNVPHADSHSARSEPAQRPAGQNPASSNENSHEDQVGQTEVAEVAVVSSRPSVDHLLPPRFLVDDPEQLNLAFGQTQHKVLLPDGDGGTARVDKRIVHVAHGGEKVSLLVMSPQQRARRKLIQNAVVIVLAIALMAAAFLLLR